VKMTDEEIDRLSTPQERSAKIRYEALQRDAMLSGVMGETELLMASEAIGILAARNERLGLVPKTRRGA
jgi:hypothetical protein